MKRYIQFLTIVLSAAALVACTEKETPVETAGGSEIKFSASIGSFQVKATDTAFQKGDAIGLFADDPVSASNARLSWDGSTLVPDTPLHWGVNQDVNQSVPFFAYYPYSGNASRSFSFQVAPDQTDAAAFSAADLMLASSSAAPKDGSVRLNFSHRMARVVIVAQSAFPGTEVTGVSVSGVVLKADVDVTALSVKATGQAATVKAAPVAGADGQKAWAVIVPAQDAQAFAVNIKLSDGSSYDLPAVAVSLNEGRSYSATAIVDQTLSAPTFSATVTDWLDSWIYLGKENDPGIMEHTWYVEASGTLQAFDASEDGTFHTVFASGRNWAQIRIVKDDYAEVWGCAIPNYSSYVYSGHDTDVIPLAPNYYFYIEGETDLFDLTLDMTAKTLTVKMLDHEWYSLGTGIFIDDLVSSLFSLPHEEIPVEVLADKYNPGLYRVMDPYKNWSWTADNFNYSEGAYIDFRVKSSGEVWFSESFTGLNMPNYGDIRVMSMVQENGWGDNYYGTYYPDYGYIEFLGNAVCNLTDYGMVMSNRNGMTSLTLPGGTRPVIYDRVEVYEHNWEQDPDLPLYIEALIKPGMDVKTIRYGVYSGHLSVEEVFGKNKDGLCYTDVKTNGTLMDFIPDSENILRVDVPQHGTYTLVLYSEGVTGRGIGAFTHHWTWETDNYPEPSMSVDAEASEYFPDIEALAKVEFQDPSEVYVLAIEDSVFSASGLSDGDIYDYTLSNASPKSASYFSSAAGALYRINSLRPNTKYRIFAAGLTNYGQSAWVQTTITTSPAPGFSSVGTGNYHDNFYNAFGPEGAGSPVEILQADTNPNRFRVMAPYQEFWSANANSGEFSYAGFSSDYIDCAVDGDKFVYAPYYCGYYEPDMGPVKYSCVYDSIDYLFATGNTALQEGVYNIAPYAFIDGTRYYYNLTSYLGVIYLEMPGYSYAEPSGAPRRVVRNTAIVEAPSAFTVAAGSTVLPFTRHMIKTTASVKAEVSPVFSAEPLKK